jgi:hypothetical protein
MGTAGFFKGFVLFVIGLKRFAFSSFSVSSNPSAVDEGKWFQ